MNENELSNLIIAKCIKIHCALGPGLLESVYEEILYHELTIEKLKCDKQKPISVIYDGLKLDIGFKADLIIENKVILELKSVESILPVHKKQLLTYLRLTGLRLGMLINFNEELIKHGIIRVVNNL